MRPAHYQPERFKAFKRAPLRALFVAAAVSGLLFLPAAAENNGNEGNNGKNDGHPNQGQNWQKVPPGHHGNPGNHYGNYPYRPVYPQPYYYAQPVYVPPPVYYPQWQTPGINLIFPLDLR